ncbi:MAG: hypothetical protein J6P02_03845 [Lachnospiraceae bacterium]|nr:hypothetical protein [Lachnospiraceae bacterium]
MGAVATGARDLTENAFFGGNKTNAEILSNMGISFVTSAGISYLGDTLIFKMNAAKANSGVQACKKAEVDYSESNAKPLNSNNSNAVYGNTNGWKVGDPVDAPTRNGNYPSWNTVKSRFWKNEAFNNPADYTQYNLDLMKKGLAPRDEIYNVPMEIHHINGRNIPNPHNIENLEKLWPWEHAAKDPYRYWTAPKE